MVISPAPTSQTDVIAMPEHTGPDSLLYYGTVRVTARDAQGRPTQLSLTNDQGSWTLTADESTAWVDSGKHAASDPADLKDGEQVYVALAYDHTRPQEQLPTGCALAVLRMAQAHAYIGGRDYVIPEDAAAVFGDVCAHRLVLSPKAKLAGKTQEDVIREVLSSVRMPLAGA